jgi:hypothetical protein
MLKTMGRGDASKSYISENSKTRLLLLLMNAALMLTLLCRCCAVVEIKHCCC